MDGCPITFLASPLLQLNPEFSSGTWDQQALSLEVMLTFDAVMDTSVVPAIVSWEVIKNSITIVPDVITWVGQELRLFFNVIAPSPGANPTVELLVEDSNLHALAGQNVLPFGPETVPEL